jgi:hypothetical protein
MPDRIIVDPDITACMREDRRVYLSHLVNSGRRVRVMNPLRRGAWEGVIFGLADHPTLLLRLDDGRERTLPQHFAVEEIEPLAVSEHPAGIDVHGELTAAVEEIDAGRVSTARQILVALLAALDKEVA